MWCLPASITKVFVYGLLHNHGTGMLFDIGPHRDLAGDLSSAVKNAGLHMGFYYSLFEWFNPQYKINVDAYVNERMLPQMKDLVTPL